MKPTLTRADLVDTYRGPDAVRVSAASGEDGIAFAALGAPFVSVSIGGNVVRLDPDLARTFGTGLLAAARVADRPKWGA